MSAMDGELSVVEVNVHLGGVVDVDAVLDVNACDYPPAQGALLNEVINAVDTVDLLERDDNAEVHSSAVLPVISLCGANLDAPHASAIRLPHACGVFQRLADMLHVVPLAIEPSGFPFVGILSGLALRILV